MTLLKVTGLMKDYFDGPRIIHVLKGVELEVQRGEAVVIMGASGTGKSTLLHLIGALDRPTEGDIVLNGRRYSQLGSVELAELRCQYIGFVFQFHYLLPEFTALENVFIPAMIRNRTEKKRASKLREKARGLLERVGLGERLHHRPVKLSGGEQQRVALCRALINDPLLVLADEPTGDLDQETGREMLDIIWQHTVSAGRSLILVTHNPEIANRAERVFHLRDGRLHPA